MDKKTLLQMWDHLRQVNGINLRAVALIPADKLDSHPIPNMRTPKELVVHMYDAVVRAMITGVAAGEIKIEETDGQAGEKKIAAGLKTREDLLKFARDCWDTADKSTQAISETQLNAITKTPWGWNPPGFVMYSASQDEFIHHRGQLYAYLRALGVEPPMMWDFEHNEPAFQPKQHAQG